MKKSLLISLYSAGLGLVIASCCLLLNPVTAYASSCTTTCSNGSSITTPSAASSCGCAGQTCTYTLNGTGYTIRCS
jgi:hypothetical protein